VNAPARRPVRTIFLGSGHFAEPTLAALAARPSIDVVAVVTAPTRPAGRRRAPTATPIKRQALELGLRVRTPERLRDPSAVADLLAMDPALVVLADYGQIVPSELLAVRHGALNLHPSLLPRHRGATPIPAAILAGDTETGITLIRMDTGIDTGPIVAVERSVLAADETAPALEGRLATMASELLVRTLDPWLDGDLPAVTQPEAGATMTRPLRRLDGLLDPNVPATLLERRIRAYLPWPGTYLDLDGQRLVALAGSVAPSEPGDEPGLIVPDRGGLALATADGRLVLDEVQPAGGRPMTGAAFVRGRPSIVGRRVSRPTSAVPTATTAPQGVSAADPAGDPA
jgi:methionyl-tRNA formyltransferase